MNTKILEKGDTLISDIYLNEYVIDRVDKDQAYCGDAHFNRIPCKDGHYLSKGYNTDNDNNFFPRENGMSQFYLLSEPHPHKSILFPSESEADMKSIPKLYRYLFGIIIGGALSQFINDSLHLSFAVVLGIMLGVSLIMMVLDFIWKLK